MLSKSFSLLKIFSNMHFHTADEDAVIAKASMGIISIGNVEEHFQNI